MERHGSYGRTINKRHGDNVAPSPLGQKKLGTGSFDLLVPSTAAASTGLALYVGMGKAVYIVAADPMRLCTLV